VSSWICALHGGRYAGGWTGGEKVKGYLEEDRIPPDSRTETYAAIRIDVDNRCWAGVPFYLISEELRRMEADVVFERALKTLLDDEQRANSRSAAKGSSRRKSASKRTGNTRAAAKKMTAGSR
jgi:glucose-6-phosphate 1-dehydrogenase